MCNTVLGGGGGVSKNRKTISADPIQTSVETSVMFSDF